MSKLAVQLYTLRDHLTTTADVVASLAKIRAIGYTAVQVSAVKAFETEFDAQTLRTMLDDNGLRCIATHRSWEALATQTDAEIELHHTLGCDYVAIGGIPSRYGADHADGYRRFVTDAQPIIATLKDAGIRFGHHNHSHEFIRIAPSSPKTLWDILIEEGGPDYFLETDLYWVWHAGVDPAALIRRTTGRNPVIHLKDKEVANTGERIEPVIAAIGEGNLPWDTILPACEESGVDWYAVEQDTCRRDPFDCLRSSYEFLTSKGL